MRKFFALNTLSILLFSASAQLEAQSFYSRTAASSKKYSDVQNELKDLALRYSENVELITIGNSDAGVPIEGLKIGNGTTSHLIVGTHHGNEYGATEVSLAAARDLSQTPVEGKTIYVVPVLNTNGYDRKSRYEKVGNSSFDPNRDYPGPCGTNGPWALKSTSAIARFLDEKNIVASATIHTYWPTVAYPWGNSTDNFETLYDQIFINLAKSATIASNYEIGYSGQVIYPADGTFEDYAYWKHGAWSLLFEVGSSHYPSESDIDEMNRVNVPGLRKMMEDAPIARAENHNFTANCRSERLIDLELD